MKENDKLTLSAILAFESESELEQLQAKEDSLLEELRSVQLEKAKLARWIEATKEIVE